MTVEDRLAALESRVAEIDQRTVSLIPLGPRRDDAAERQVVIDRITKAIAKAVGEVDRSARTLTNGSPVTDDHREINPESGQQKGYVVLSAEERDKGFVRPVRTSYVHKKCGAVTTMALSITETYARDPGFYDATFCVQCRLHLPLEEFVWDGTDEQVGS